MQNQETTAEDQPPIFGSWSNIYWAVLILHALIITLFYVFTQAFA